MTTRFMVAGAALAACLTGAPASAQAVQCVTISPPGNIPEAKLVVLDSDSTVTSTFCGGSAGYTSDAYLVSPGTQYLGTGNITPAGHTVDLGAFLAGSELVFSIYVRNTGYTYYTGPASRNPDNRVHAAVTELSAGVFHVGFEDLFGGGDLDNDDVNLVIEANAVVVGPNPTDTDDDSIPDYVDNCIYVPNTNQADANGNGIGDACEGCADGDDDGECDATDNCPDDANAEQGDADGDGLGDACDACPSDAENDADGDGFCADQDNCPDDANAGQGDADADGLGDACDPCTDPDSDGICDGDDLCPGTASPENVPTEGLGVNRWADIDGDGVFDTKSPKGKGPQLSFTIEDTRGCSCEQIIEAMDLGEGHAKFGCSIGAMRDWIELNE